MNQENTKPAPILYLPHGGGPLPLLADPGHEKLIQFLQTIPQNFELPDAILVISAHWEETHPTLTSGVAPDLIYDYEGFPPESYEIQYPAPGCPGLADEIAALLTEHAIVVQQDSQRGFDHGMFVPLKLMYPEAMIPCLQLSLLNNLDATSHIALGKALSPLREKNILILGSGMSFHDIRSFFVPGLVSENDNLAFDNWLKETCVSESLSAEEREQRLINWQQAPGALTCHPRPEHLLPLHVCFGMAMGKGEYADLVFNDKVLDKTVSGFLW